MPSSKSAQSDTLKDRVLLQLQQLIVAGQLVPGAKLLETQLAETLGVSRATLREAMNRLVEIGLLENKPFRGTYIRDLSRVDLTEIYSLRTCLEQMAFKICWPKRSRVALADLHMRNDDLLARISANDACGAITSELRLHSWCYELSGHSLLLQSWERLKPNLQFYFTLHQQAHGREGPQRESHNMYIELAHGDNLEDMLEHLEMHMQQGLTRTLQFVDSQ